MDAVRNIEKCSVVTAMTRNGTEFGIQVSGLGDQWFTAPASQIRGVYFTGFSAQDACLDLGDSAILEAGGLGGMALATSPGTIQVIGLSAIDAVNSTKSMYEITAGKNLSFQIPHLDFQGIPAGIDIRKVVDRGIVPEIPTGIAHKDAGGGRIGVGFSKPPISVFKDALVAFAAKVR